MSRADLTPAAEARVYNLSEPADQHGWRKPIWTGPITDAGGTPRALREAATGAGLPSGVHRLALVWPNGDLAVDDVRVVVPTAAPRVSTTRRHEPLG